jgi:hypothetical protein
VLCRSCFQKHGRAQAAPVGSAAAQD